MCQAIREMREESQQIGIAIGEERMKEQVKKAEARIRELELLLAQQAGERKE